MDEVEPNKLGAMGFESLALNLQGLCSRIQSKRRPNANTALAAGGDRGSSKNNREKSDDGV